MKNIGVILTLIGSALLLLKTDAFSFNLKSVGATKVTVTPGDLIIYNAYLTITQNTTLSFHVRLPYDQTPIFNVEKIEVVGQGKNLYTSQEVVTYTKEDSNSYESRSESSIDFGNVTYYSNSKPGDDLIVQIQSRLLDHSEVTAGKVFWLYYGMNYLNDAVWVIGKSVKAEIQTGPAKLGVSLKLPDGLSPIKSAFKFLVNINHHVGSRGNASSLVITLSAPSTMRSATADSQGASPAFNLVTDSKGLTLRFSEMFKVGQRAAILIKMSFNANVKGDFYAGNIYGSYSYDTDLDGSGSCTNIRTVEKKDVLHLPFRFYVTLDNCDTALESTPEFKASSAKLPCCDGKYAKLTSSFDNKNWEPWRGDAGLRHVDDFIQVDFDKKTTVVRLKTTGFVAKKQYVRSFHVSYSQNSVHWEYIKYLGEKKEFEGNKNEVDEVMTVFPTPVSAWHLRIHVVKYSPAGASIKMKLYGCEDPLAAKSYETYQRGFIGGVKRLIICNVHPDKNEGKSNCYLSRDHGMKWEPMNAVIVNIIGLHMTTNKLYGLGISSSDNPIYMEILNPQSFRVIPKEDWDAVKSGCQLPQVIPLSPVHGDKYKMTHTPVTFDSVKYVASPEGLLKQEGNGSYRMIASWIDFTNE